MAYTSDFRIFYNTSIHPELQRLEANRKRRIRLLAFAVFLGITVLLFHRYFPILPLTLTLLTFLGFFISYGLYRLRKFVLTFKPRIVRLLLDLIDDSPNFGDLRYEPKQWIPLEKFRESGLFHGHFEQYLGEDYISGKIGEVDFELCEVAVRELSKVRNRLNYVFRGAFMIARLQHQMRGEILLIPEKHRQWQSRTIKKAIERDVIEARATDQLPEFDDEYLTLASKDTLIREILSYDMQRLILDFQQSTGEAVYFSYRNRYIYVAVTHQDDLLEPKLFQSNVSFALIQKFYQDLMLLLSIVEDFDRNH